jgi:hypothetical protein
MANSASHCLPATKSLLPFRLAARVARFFLVKLTKTGKFYQITLKYSKWPQNIPKGRKIDQMAIKHTNIFHCKSHPEFTQIWIFGLKICHLATLLATTIKPKNCKSAEEAKKVDPRQKVSQTLMYLVTIPSFALLPWISQLHTRWALCK